MGEEAARHRAPLLLAVPLCTAFTLPVTLDIAADTSDVPLRKFSVLHCNIGSPVKHSLHFAGAQSSGQMLLARCTFLLVLFN